MPVCHTELPLDGSHRLHHLGQPTPRFTQDSGCRLVYARKAGVTGREVLAAAGRDRAARVAIRSLQQPHETNTLLPRQWPCEGSVEEGGPGTTYQVQQCTGVGGRRKSGRAWLIARDGCSSSTTPAQEGSPQWMDAGYSTPGPGPTSGAQPSMELLRCQRQPWKVGLIDCHPQ